jgi:hypothetical protein
VVGLVRWVLGISARLIYEEERIICPRDSFDEATYIRNKGESR